MSIFKGSASEKTEGGASVLIGDSIATPFTFLKEEADTRGESDMIGEKRLESDQGCPTHLW